MDGKPWRLDPQEPTWAALEPSLMSFRVGQIPVHRGPVTSAGAYRQRYLLHYNLVGGQVKPASRSSAIHRNPPTTAKHDSQPRKKIDFGPILHIASSRVRDPSTSHPHSRIGTRFKSYPCTPAHQQTLDLHSSPPPKETHLSGFDTRQVQRRTERRKWPVCHILP